MEDKVSYAYAIIGDNPSRYEILYQLNAKRHALFKRVYVMQKLFCPVCGSDNVELIIEEE